MQSTFQHYVQQPAQEMFNFRSQPYSARGEYEQINSSHSSPYLPQTPPPFNANSSNGYNYHHNRAYSSSLLRQGGGVEDVNYEQQKPESETANHRLVVQRFNKIQRRSDIIFAVADLASCLLTLAMESIMVYVLIKFYRTRNIPATGRKSPWANGTTVWSTYMLAGASLAFLIMSAISLVLTCSRKAHTRSNITVTVVKVVLHVGVWGTVAAFYRIGKTGKDLWGWSCIAKATAVQAEYVDVLDFEQLCRVQTSSWVLSIAEAVVKLVFAVVAFRYQIKASGIKRTIAKDVGVGAAGIVANVQNMNL